MIYVKKTVYRFRKNASEEVRIGIEDYRGHRCVDMRCYVLPPTEGGKAQPTPKGLKIRVEQLPELQKGMERIEKSLASNGSVGAQGSEKVKVNG